MKEKEVLRYVLVGTITITLFTILMILKGGFTGYAIFEDSGTNFNQGTYVNTTYNGSSVILSSNNLTGTYISQIFNAGSNSFWNNISWQGKKPNINYLYAVDGAGNVFNSIDYGITWIQKVSNYGRTTDTQYMFADSDYIYIISNSNKEVWRSGDLGVTWNVVNDNFADSGLLVGDADSNNNLFVIDASGDVYLSSDRGVTWTLKGDFNAGATNNAKGITINSSNDIYVVDGAGDVYVSTDSAIAWTKINDGYGGGTATDDMTIDSNNNLYILLNKKIYQSTDNGVTWSLINNSFTSYSNDGLRMSKDSFGNLYIADAKGRIFKSIDLGISWQEQGDFNAGATNDAKGLVSFIQATNLSFQAKTCNNSLCSEEKWEGPYGADELSNNNIDETTYNSNGANMTGNVLLMHLNDISGNPVDNSGKENTVSFIRGINYGIQGKFNTSLDFNGINGTIDLDYNDSNFNFSRSGAFTVAGWIKPSGLHQGGDAEIISHYKSTTENRVWSLHIRNNVTRFVACSDGTSSSCIYATGTTKVELDNWYYIVGRWNGSNIDVYLNGVSEDSQADVLTNLHSTNDTGIRIGRDVSIIGEGWFNGTIDEIAIWNRSLSDNEILNLYYKGINNTFINNFSSLSLKANPYFQYKVDFTTLDSSITPFLNSVSIDYTVLNTAPAISIISPNDSATYGYNQSLNLNFTVSDAEDNLDSCWYNLGENNISIIGCNNITFNISEGSHTLIVYVNDSLGLEKSDSVNFSIQVSPPTVILQSPINNYFNYNNIQFNYTPIDIDLDSCELWGNFTGLFQLNQSDISLTNNQTNTFQLNLSDGKYLWNIKCNDSQGDFAFATDNLTFYIDTTNPNLTLSEPLGIKTSMTSIPLTFLYNDTNMGSCWYNIYQGASIHKLNTTIINCISTTFDVSATGNFILNLYSNDSAGNTNSINSSFSVSVSTPPSPSTGGGGSGGGGGSIISKNKTGKLKVSTIGEIIAQQGDKKTLSINVENTGRVFLNNCKLSTKGDIKSWIYSTQIQGIAPGENIEFIFDLNIPEGINAKDYSGELEIKCNEGINNQELRISIPKELQIVEIKNIKHKKEGLDINYNFYNKKSKEKNVNVEIWIVNSDKIEIKRITDSFLSNKEITQREILIKLPENTIGIHDVYFALSSNKSNFVKQSIVLGESKTTGQAILGEGGSKLAGYLVFFLMLGVLIFFGIKGHFKNKKISSIKKVKKTKKDSFIKNKKTKLKKNAKK